MWVSSYSYYGLNRKRNWLHAPECDCGCGEKMLICLPSDDDLFEFCAGVLSERHCTDSAIFIVRQDGNMQIAVYNPENDSAYAVQVKNPSTHSFSDFDGEAHLCCYSLLVEKDLGHYMIVE